MKINKELFEKKIDLSTAEINGGRLASTFTSCSVFTNTTGCSDSIVTVTNDKGVVTDRYLNTNC